MKRKQVILILLVIIFFTTGIVALVHFFTTTVDVRDMEMDLLVGDRLGINTDTDKLWFGMTNPGGSASRTIILTNDYDFPVRVKILLFGELRGYVTMPENNFIIEPGTQKDLGVTAYVPSTMPYGHYTGTLRAVFKKA